MNAAERILDWLSRLFDLMAQLARSLLNGLGSLFGLSSKGGKIWLALFLVLTLFSIWLFLQLFRVKPSAPIDAPTIVGVVLSIVVLFWSVAINLSQRDQTAILTDQKRQLNELMAGQQRYCADLHTAMAHLEENWIKKINALAKSDPPFINVSMYVSSFALGCISPNSEGPTASKHALEIFADMLGRYRQLLEARIDTGRGLVTNLHLYVWDEDQHLEWFALDARNTKNTTETLELNRGRISRCCNELAKICKIFENHRQPFSSLHIHHTPPGVMRFFEVEYSDYANPTASKLMNDDSRTAATVHSAETAMILMMPDLGMPSSSRDGTAAVDLSCLLVTDQTEVGRERMSTFFGHYKRNCCDKTEDCSDEAREKGLRMIKNPDEFIKAYFGNGL